MGKLEEIQGIGKKTAVVLKKMGIETTEDLVNHFPRRYEKYEYPVYPGDATEGKQAVIGTVNSNFYYGNKGLVSLRISDAKGSVSLSWFHNPYIDRILKYGETYVFCGNISMFNGRPNMAQPVFYTIEEYRSLAGTIMPIYPLKKGIANSAMFRFVLQALTQFEHIEDTLPDNIRQKYGLYSRADALRCIHYPSNWEVLRKARERLVFDEFFTLLYSVRYRSFARGENSFKFYHSSEMETAARNLPYPLTNAQRNTVDIIKKDMSGFLVTNRLVQGDVGCGKTIVAILLMILAAENGYQAALMAPTEVLANQHYLEAKKILDGIGKTDEYNPVLLTGSLKEKEKKELRSRIKNGESRIIIGTHALIQEKTEYSNLALVVIDEQHRFGVEQREAFSKKSSMPIHTVIMTATPIPRTTGNILFGGMDVSVINEKPAKRLHIKSCMAMPSMRNAVYKLIYKEITQGKQCYVICPMVEGEQDDEKKNVEEHRNTLQQVYPGVNIGILHGKMNPEEKQEQMEKFASGESRILVATTVVEVGVNVPNATVIVVENADMFGMLQLHQLRGRVGRGDSQSYCVFMNSKEEFSEKLDVVSKTENGFEIAEADYRMRKAGELLGTKQSGDMGFKLADMVRDEEILRKAEEAVDSLIPKI